MNIVFIINILIIANFATLLSCTHKLPEHPIDFKASRLYSMTEDSIMNMKCSGELPYDKITCSFIKTNIAKKEPQYFEEISKQLINQNESHWTRFFDSCKEMLPEMDGIVKEANSTSPAKKEKIIQGVSWIKELCNCGLRKVTKRIPCASAIMKLRIQNDINVCFITTTESSVHLKKSEANKWISELGQKEDCTQQIITVEHQTKKNKFWTVTQNFQTNLNNVCVSKAEVFSWKGHKTALLKCDSIEFE